MLDVLLIIHILAVCLWLGGSIMNGVINMGVMKQANLEANTALARAEVKFGTTYYMPMAVTTLLSGIALILVGDDGYGFGDPWVSFGFLAIIVAAILGPTKLQPASDAMLEKFEAGDGEGGAAAGMEIAKWSKITTGLILISVILMVIKPA